MKRPATTHCILVLFLFLAGASALMAQMPTATILGVVKDASGAVIPSATLTARSLETGLTRTVQSAGDGSFRFSALPVGNYEVRAEHSGFETDVRSGLTLTVAQEAVVNFTLQVGSVEQQVVVSAEAPLVNTTSGSLASLVDEKKVADLPLNGRNWADLTLLQPGITQHRNIGSNPTSGGLWYSSNGAPVRSNNYLLDGAPMVSFLGANASSLAGGTLGIDGIREYKIITNAFSAEYGMTMGSQVTLVSKGGTNSWSGDVFEYIRNSALDARNYFDAPPSQLGRRLPQFQRNNFGGAFGGPIKKDKTFFYGAYEGLRQRTGLTIVDNVMDAGCHGPAGAVVWNGLGTRPAGAVGPCSQLGPNPAGTPSNSVTISAVTAPLLAIFPNPNLPGAKFTYPYTSPTRDDFAQMRVDQTFSAKDSLFVRYTIDDADVTTAVSTPAGLQSYPGYNVLSNSRSQFITLSETRIFSPTVVNTARFSFSRTAPRTDSNSPYSGPQFAYVPANSNELGNLQISGLSSLGPHATTPTFLPQNVYTWSDDLFYTRGKHSLKLGTLINRYQMFDFTSRGYRGTAIFASTATFLRGIVQSYNALTPGSNTTRNYRYTTLGFYAQDDYRLAPRFTLNLGLRYEFMTQLHEKDGIQAAIRNMQTDAGPTVGIPFRNPTLHNFSPRVGFAWDVRGDGKTAVRGGFGLLYDLGTYGTAFNVIQPNARPFSSNSTVINPTQSATLFTIPFTFPPSTNANTTNLFDYNIQQPHLLSYNLTVERQLPWAMGLSLAYAGSRGIDLLATRDGNPKIPQGVPVNGVCSVRPSGQAVDLTSMVDGSATACWLGTDPFNNPNIPNSVTLINAPASSFYNALQVGLSKRASRGLQFQSSYTWGKLIDDPQSEAMNVISSSPVQPTDAFHNSTDRGLSAYDVKQNWRFNVIYQVPQVFGAAGVLGKALSGWQMSGIVTLQSGYPFTVNLAQNRSRSGAFQSLANLDRPDLAPGRSIESITNGVSTANGIDPCPTAGQQLGTPSLWYDPCAFTIPAAGFLGNEGRNILRGPGLSNLDFSLVKNTAIQQLGERARVEFRVEFFNVLNHANFDMPGRTAYAATTNVQAPLSSAGTIVSTGLSTARQIQLALKFLF